MESEGFTVFPFEWWHFDYKDWLDYAIYDIAFSEIGKKAPVGKGKSKK